MSLDGFQKFEIGKWGLGIIFGATLFIFGRYSQYIQANTNIINNMKSISDSQGELKVDVKDIKQIMTTLLLENQSVKTDLNNVKYEMEKHDQRLTQLENNGR